MRIGREKSDKVRLLIQDVDENGKVKKTKSLTVYESDLAEVHKIVETALTEAARRKASR